MLKDTMMKRFNFLIAFLLVAAVSCNEEEFLGQVPKDQLTSEAYYKNANQIEVGVVGCYIPLQSTYNGSSAHLVWTVGMISDDFTTQKNNSSVGGAPFVNINRFTKTTGQSQGSIWNTAYNNIARCNRMIQVINAKEYEATGQEALINSYLGEVRFIRALNYFNLVRLYGPVPLVVEPFYDPSLAVGMGRTDVSTIYNEVVIPDFAYAAENCLLRSEFQATQLGRITSGAGYTMLAKAYLTLDKLAEAEQALHAVITSGEYDLRPQLGQVFNVSSENNQESIFEIQFDETLEDGSSYNHWVDWEIQNFSNIDTRASGDGLWVSDELVETYKNTGDLERFGEWIVDYTENPTTGSMVYSPYPKKLITLHLANMNQDNNFIVTRYADVILMYAEALVRQDAGRAGEIIDEVNRIRTRASMPELAAADLTLDAILHERRMELSFEGHRWFDLLRTNRAIDIMEAHLGKTVPEFQLLLPIPVGEIQKDPAGLVQNEGY